jgi:hypothetical protein
VLNVSLLSGRETTAVIFWVIALAQIQQPFLFGVVIPEGRNRESILKQIPD